MSIDEPVSTRGTTGAGVWGRERPRTSPNAFTPGTHSVITKSATADGGRKSSRSGSFTSESTREYPMTDWDRFEDEDDVRDRLDEWREAELERQLMRDYQ